MLTKAGALALGWLALPYWLFALVAAGFYFVPWFRPAQLFLPFALTVGFGGTLGLLLPELWVAVLLWAAFALIFGVKDLVLIERGMAYEALAFLLYFLLYIQFFARFDHPGRPLLLPLSLIAAAFSGGLMGGAIRYARAAVSAGSPDRTVFLAALGGFLLWQWGLVLVFLPLNFFYQTALQFLAAVLLTELFSAHATERLDRRRILLHFSLFFIFVTLILAATPWAV